MGIANATQLVFNEVRRMNFTTGVFELVFWYDWVNRPTVSRPLKASNEFKRALNM